jgi:hypothetical protein
MKGRVTIKHRLVGLIGIMFSLGILSIGILLFLFENEISGMLIVSGTMFLWMGLGYLGLLLMNMKTLELKDEKLIIGTFFGLNKKQYSFKDIKSINPMSFSNLFASYPGLLVKLKDERQIHLHEMEFKNFAYFKKVITDKVDRDSTLEIEIWTPFAKTFVAIGGLILLSFVIVKIVGL